MSKVKKTLAIAGLIGGTFAGAHFGNNYLQEKQCLSYPTGTYLGKGTCMVENKIINMNTNTIVNQGGRQWTPPEKLSE